MNTPQMEEKARRRSALLGSVLYTSSERFKIYDASRVMGIQNSATRHTLDQMVDEGILESSSDPAARNKNTKLYRRKIATDWLRIPWVGSPSPTEYTPIFK